MGLSIIWIRDCLEIAGLCYDPGIIALCFIAFYCPLNLKCSESKVWQLLKQCRKGTSVGIRRDLKQAGATSAAVLLLALRSCCFPVPCCDLHHSALLLGRRKDNCGIRIGILAAGWGLCVVWGCQAVSACVPWHLCSEVQICFQLPS